MRDDFKTSTKEQLARRVGFRCSNLNCQRPTSGPHTIENKSVSIGVAAHITAASLGGPRFEPNFSVIDRCSAINGIWLCQACAKLIDSDPIRYSADTLRKWKTTAEERIRKTIESPFPPIDDPLTETYKKTVLVHSSQTSKRSQIIDALTARYLGRYQQKLDERIPLTLRFRFTEQGTTKQYAFRYFVKETPSLLNLSSELAAVLDKCSYLLMIGKPGAGKTTILLDLALSFLARARADEAFPIPVIFNLASWHKDQSMDFARWLEDVLIHGNGLSRPLAKKLIEEHHLLPLLDGFDEIGRIARFEKDDRDLLRSKCLAAINDFMWLHEPKKLVICSRIDEYIATMVDAPVKGEILLQPLEVVEVQQTLRSALADPLRQTTHPFGNITAAQNMLYWIGRNSVFAQLVTVPFYFNLASQALCIQTARDVLPEDEGVLSRVLIERFLDTKYATSRHKNFSQARKNNYWLSNLAKILNHKNEITFELTLLQPSLLRFPRRFGFLYSFVFGLVIGGYFFWALAFVILVFGSSSEDPEASPAAMAIGFMFLSLINSLIWGGIAGLAGWCGLWGRASEIVTEDIRHWALSAILSARAWVNIAKFTLSGVTKGLKFGLIVMFPSAFLASLNHRGLIHLFIGLAGGAMFGVGGGLVFGAVNGLLRQLSAVADFYETRTPLQKLKGGLLFYPLKWALVMSLASFIFGYSVFEIRQPLSILSLLLIPALLGAIIGFLLTPFYKHFVLRFCLILEGVIPWRLETFLKYATRIRILEWDSGKWRFRHQILQDYFASF